MSTVVIVIIAGLLFYFLYYVHTAPARRGIVGFVVRQSRKKQQNKGRIIEYLRTHERMTNREAQELLSISDSTAVRYFDELQSEGRVEQVGETGQSVFYRLNTSTG